MNIIAKSSISLVLVGLFAASLCLAAFFMGHAPAIPGLLYGSLVSALYYLLACYRVRRSADLPPARAAVYMRAGAAVRLGFIALALILLLQISPAAFVPAVIGLFSFQMTVVLRSCCIVTRSFLHRKQYK